MHKKKIVLTTQINWKTKQNSTITFKRIIPPCSCNFFFLGRGGVTLQLLVFLFLLFEALTDAWGLCITRDNMSKIQSKWCHLHAIITKPRFSSLYVNIETGKNYMCLAWEVINIPHTQRAKDGSLDEVRIVLLCHSTQVNPEIWPLVFFRSGIAVSPKMNSPRVRPWRSYIWNSKKKNKCEQIHKNSTRESRAK